MVIPTIVLAAIVSPEVPLPPAVLPVLLPVPPAVAEARVATVVAIGTVPSIPYVPIPAMAGDGKTPKVVLARAPATASRVGAEWFASKVYVL